MTSIRASAKLNDHFTAAQHVGSAQTNHSISIQVLPSLDTETQASKTRMHCVKPPDDMQANVRCELSLSACFLSTPRTLQVSLVVSQPGKPRGRGNASTPLPSPVEALARSQGLGDDFITCPARANEVGGTHII